MSIRRTVLNWRWWVALPVVLLLVPFAWLSELLRLASLSRILYRSHIMIEIYLGGLLLAMKEWTFRKVPK